MDRKRKEVAIIGGGPGGMAAALYADQSAEVSIFAPKLGGQIEVSDLITNFLGIRAASGRDIINIWRRDVEEKSLAKILEGQKIKRIVKVGKKFELINSIGDVFEVDAALIVTGANYRKLGIAGENKYHGRGIYNCAICDGHRVAGGRAVVIGGGNSANQIVNALIEQQNASVTQIINVKKLTGNASTIEKLKAWPKNKYKLLSEVKINAFVGGEVKVTGVKIINKNGKELIINMAGAFVAIGLIPNSGLVRSKGSDLVKVNRVGEIIVDPWTMKTSVDGLYAAGDVANVMYNQAIITAGDAVRGFLAMLDYVNDTVRMSPCADSGNCY